MVEMWKNVGCEGAISAASNEVEIRAARSRGTI
jgi:hypothetical protein